MVKLICIIIAAHILLYINILIYVLIPKTSSDLNSIIEF